MSVWRLTDYKNTKKNAKWRSFRQKESHHPHEQSRKLNIIQLLNEPDWYNGLNEKFVHIITREVKENSRKSSRKIREFRSERALRIHWIKPILENCNDKRIRRFKCLKYSGREREYFWFVKGYMVIVEFINPEVALITGFCVDQDNQSYYLRKYQDRIK